jgi:DeoR/GlpR family transcriptional regulator of sugar metabolism
MARNQRNPDEKFLIASLVAEQVRPGMTVIIDGGSTTFAVARLIVDKQLQVNTNSLPIASLFGEIGSVGTVVTGGSIYRRLGILIGPLCEQAFEHTHADLAILGGVGIEAEGVWGQNALIASAQRKMIAAAERTNFAFDNTKFGRKALSLSTPFASRFTIVTDVRPAPEVARAIAVSGARLTPAEKKPVARS